MAVKNLTLDYLRSMNLTLYFPSNNVQFQSLSSLKKEFIYSSENEPDLLAAILNTDVGTKLNNIEYASFQSIKSKPFEKFKTRHKSMNFLRIFLHRKNYFKKCRKVNGQIVCHYIENKKCDNQIHPAHIREGLQTILYKVISEELIGNNRNKKKILKSFHNFLLTAKTEPFSLYNLITGLNISSIKWLSNIRDELTKYVLVAKFIKWLFQYLISITCYRFHVTYLKGERIFIFIENWNQQKGRYLKKMNNKMALEPVNKICDNNKLKNKLFLIPKREGFRSIIKSRYRDVEKDEMRKIISILKYLYDMHLNITNDCFNDEYLEIIKEKNYSRIDQIYVTSADISDAYGSIRPAKLFHIIKVLFTKLPDNLILQWYISKNIKKYKFGNLDVNLLKLENTINKFQVIEKCFILQKLKECIYNIKVIIDSKVYNLCKGVGQGLMLSAVLCNIYYAHMQKKYFSIFKKSGHLFTYVDDSIYVTSNLAFATKYKSRIKQGIPEYNCWYNKFKLRSNLNCNATKKQNHIKYLGWNVDPHSLEIQPCYSTPRYSINFTTVNNLTLINKLQTLTSLKLNKLILCKELNSGQQIFENIKIISLQQAERCYAIINSLVQKNNNYNWSIKIIEKVNFKMLLKVDELTNWSKIEKKNHRKKLQLIILKTFYRVFSKRNNIFLPFNSELKKLLKICKRKNKI